MAFSAEIPTICSTELEEECLASIWTTAESLFPGAPWFGLSTCGNIDDCEVSPICSVVVLYGGDEFYVESIKISGWKQIGRNFRVTKAKGNVVYELDGIPAYDVYYKYLNIENDENFFVNALEFQEGSIIRLSYGEPQTIMEAIQQESQKIMDFTPDMLHVFYCAARKAFWMSQEPTYEIKPFKTVCPSTGFFSHGEFLREKGHLNQHSITLVLAAMREGPCYHR